MARNVNSACGIPKIIAIRSITNVDWIKRFRRTNANPSLTAAHPVALPGSRSGGIGCIKNAARKRAPYVTRSIAYAAPKPNFAIRSPPTAEPTIPTVCHSTWLSATADGMSALPTSRGVIAERVGVSTELTNAWSALAR